MGGSTRACVMTDAAANPQAVGIWSQLSRRRGAMFSLGVIVALTLAAWIGPFLSPHAIDALDWANVATGPSIESGHWLGTDRLGRDLLVRTLHGARISLLIGLL